MVTASTPTAAAAARTSPTSSAVSPRPTMRPVLTSGRAGAAVAAAAGEDRVGPARALRLRRLARPRGGARQQRQRALVARLRPHVRVQARDGLEVVVEHVRAGGEDGAQRRFVAAQVRDEHLHGRVRRGGAHGGDGRREVRRPAVRQVVAGDAGDHDVAQAEATRRFGDAPRLVRVEGTDGGGRSRRRPSAVTGSRPPCPRPPRRRTGRPACRRRRGSGRSPCPDA